jgi:hypothetical protein
MAGGSTLTFMLVTVISGGPTTGSDATSPSVSIKTAESQQNVEGSLGFLTYNHVESGFLPTISASLPRFKAPTTA